MSGTTARAAASEEWDFLLSFFQSNCLLASGESLQKPGRIGEWTPRAPAKAGPLVDGRICALCKRDEASEIAHAKIRKAASRKGRQVRPETLRFARYVILFTTYLPHPFPAADVLEWDRLRWQVEVVFKRFKSWAQLKHLPKYSDENAQAWLYGKLLSALLTEKVIRHAPAISP